MTEVALIIIIIPTLDIIWLTSNLNELYGKLAICSSGEINLLNLQIINILFTHQKGHHPLCNIPWICKRIQCPHIPDSYRSKYAYYPTQQQAGVDVIRPLSSFPLLYNNGDPIKSASYWSYQLLAQNLQKSAIKLFNYIHE